MSIRLQGATCLRPTHHIREAVPVRLSGTLMKFKLIFEAVTTILYHRNLCTIRLCCATRDYGASSASRGVVVSLQVTVTRVDHCALCIVQPLLAVQIAFLFSSSLVQCP